MMQYTRKRCRRCLLQEDPFHHVFVGQNGLCSICCKNDSGRRMDRNELRDIFESEIEKVRGKHSCDGLIMMSGGKDSAYLAYTLKKIYKLNIIAFINDINYEYEETFQNAKRITEKLDIPLVRNKIDPMLMREYFHFLFTEKELAERDYGQVCTFCGRFMIHAAAVYAQRNEIPLLFSGHNPEQVFGLGESYENDPDRIMRKNFIIDMINQSVKKARIICRRRGKTHLLPFFPVKLFPDKVKGLFLFQHIPYKPLEMMELIRKELGWLPVKKFSKTYIASGCRLAKLWIYLSSLNKTSNYVDFELSSQIRSGVLDRELVEKSYEEKADYKEESFELMNELGIEFEQL